jgi:membrane-bound hydrogenase subunit mbhJ
VHSMKPIRVMHVNTGSCNGCDTELLKLILDNVEFVDSIEDADAIILTGPISKNMKPKVNDFVTQISKENRHVVAIGSCSLSGGICQESEAVEPLLVKDGRVCVFGCPPRSEIILQGIEMSRKRRSKRR